MFIIFFKFAVLNHDFRQRKLNNQIMTTKTNTTTAEQHDSMFDAVLARLDVAASGGNGFGAA